MSSCSSCCSFNLIACSSGPNWIHGANNNPILDLAQETNTAVFPPEEENSAVYDESGQLLSDERGSQITELVWGIIGEAFSHSNEHSVSIPPNMSLMDFVKIRARELKLDESTSRLVLQMAETWGDYVGEPIEKQSLKYCWLEECLDESAFSPCITLVVSIKLTFSENLFVAGTYKAILARVAETALARATFHFSTKVTSIRTKVSAGSNPEVVITTAANNTFSFDEVVMTTPLGWLKRNVSVISPPVPSRLTTAIKNMSYGRLEKVYLTFPTAFWIPFIGPTRRPGTTSPVPRPPFHMRFLSPSYAPLQNPQQWTVGPVSLASLPPPNAHPTLLFYLNGPCAQHVTSFISTLPATSPRYHSLLSDFLHPYYSRLPNYNPASPACQPSKILCTNWQNDELAGWGSYTNFQISEARERKTPSMEGGEIQDGEEVRLDEDIEALREGCPDRGLWFAGEHTAPFIALGTVTGAYWSGEAVGRRIAAAYRIGDAVVAANEKTALSEE